MRPHRLPCSPLFVLVLVTACNKGQTGDVGLGVDRRNDDPGPSQSDPEDAVDSGDVGGTESRDAATSTEPDPPTPLPAPADGSPQESPSLDTALPCDVLEADNLRCVSAHSTVRVVVRGYDGPLYRLRRGGDTTLDVGSVDGFADASAHDEFCSSSLCDIEVVYDQSGMGNDLTEAPPGSAKSTPGNPVPASDLPVSIQGRSVYGMRFRPGMGYRKLEGNGLARGDEPQTIYMVTSQHDLINGCCFNYGNAETTASNAGNGAVEAVYFGMGVIWGTGSGSGPWVMADLENGLYPGWGPNEDRNISTNTSLEHDFVTAVLVGDTADENENQGRFALYGGDATSGALRTMYDGVRPQKPGYVPMQKQGSVVLAIAGDNSNGGGGRFYEGIIANGAATLQTIEALQAAIVEAGYGQ